MTYRTLFLLANVLNIFLFIQAMSMKSIKHLHDVQNQENIELRFQDFLARNVWSQDAIDESDSISELILNTMANRMADFRDLSQTKRQLIQKTLREIFDNSQASLNDCQFKAAKTLETISKEIKESLEIVDNTKWKLEQIVIECQDDNNTCATEMYSTNLKSISLHDLYYPAYSVKISLAYENKYYHNLSDCYKKTKNQTMQKIRDLEIKYLEIKVL